ncbi:MAG TPA: hypothetical protein VK524_07250, partial [Polyangiaceae bacterium]|nr:hypothetical protein [Polyangiaceae bacterium]
MKNWLRGFALVALGFVLLVALATARVLVSGEAEIAKSDRAFNEGDLHAATLHARRAATLYAPGAPHVRAAYERLAAIAVGAEATGQRGVAQNAWRAARGAALETRHVRTPHAAELERANKNLARLQAHASVAERPDNARDVRGRYARALAKLEQGPLPRTGWIVVLLLGFALCVAGLGWLALRGLTREGSFVFGG